MNKNIEGKCFSLSFIRFHFGAPTSATFCWSPILNPSELFHRPMSCCRLKSILRSVKSPNWKSRRFDCHYCESSRHAKRPPRAYHVCKASSFGTINSLSKEKHCANIMFIVPPKQSKKQRLSWCAQCSCEILNSQCRHTFAATTVKMLPL